MASTDSTTPAKHRFLLGFPYLGAPCMGFETARALYHASQNHSGRLLGAAGSWANFDQILAVAINLYNAGEITHLAFLHADIAPQDWWVDVLLAEMDRLGADMVSAIVPIKDMRGVSSSGIGDPEDNWHPLRRFTMQEAHQFPETFNAADAGYPGGILLHNDGCFVLDLSKPWVQQLDADGCLVASFEWPRKIRKAASGIFEAIGESEDWYWSRRLHELGANTYITRKVSLVHVGGFAYPNSDGWGSYRNGDEDTRDKWGANTVGQVVSEPVGV